MRNQTPLHKSSQRHREIRRFLRGDDTALRALIVVAHPDDETIGLGGSVGRLSECWVVQLTAGAPRDVGYATWAGFDSQAAYATARQRELECAMKIAGIPKERLIQLGMTDQEVVFDVPFVVEELSRLLWDIRPEVLFTHPYEGGHPDHDAAALAIHMLHREHTRCAYNVPSILEMAFYHNASEKLETGAFLAPSLKPVFRQRLSSEEQAQKQRMVACYASQSKVLSAFRTDEELLRERPLYDFRASPHPGALYYETLGFSISGAEWRAQVARVLGSYGLRPNLRR